MSPIGSVSVLVQKALDRGRNGFRPFDVQHVPRPRDVNDLDVAHHRPPCRIGTILSELRQKIGFLAQHHQHGCTHPPPGCLRVLAFVEQRIDPAMPRIAQQMNTTIAFDLTPSGGDES